MSTDQSARPAQDDHVSRIEQLKKEAEELCGTPVSSWESPDCPPEISLRFWESVVAFEKAPWTTHYEQLAAMGVEMPPAPTLSDTELSERLEELFQGLAEMRVYVSQTNHLDDRQLYTLLCENVLLEQVKLIPDDQQTSYYIDLLTGGGEEEERLYLRYYADDDYRSAWAADFPNDPIPPHEDPPFDRDRHLPKPDDDTH